MIFRLAYRNLARNRWRTFLTVGGIAVAVGLMIWTMAYMEGFTNQLVQTATTQETGQVKLQTESYEESPAIYKHFTLTDELRDYLDSHPDIETYVPRLQLFGLLGTEKRSKIVNFYGVDPAKQNRATGVKDQIITGSWLPPEPSVQVARKIVLGDTLARQLNAEVGDELVVFLQASDGSLGNDVLTVSGIANTGSSGFNRRGGYIPMQEAQFLAATKGDVHEITLHLKDLSRAGFVAEEMNDWLANNYSGEAEVNAQSWREMQPQLAEMVDVSSQSTWIMYVIMYLIAALGVLNTQRMSTLERRREFGVMMAIGTNPKILAMVVAVETIFMTIIGAIGGVILGGSVSLYHEAYGLDMSYFLKDSDFSYMGINFSQSLEFSLTSSVILEPVLVMIGAAVVSSIWPAMQGALINIPKAISGRD